MGRLANIGSVLYILGILLTILAVSMVIPAIADIQAGNPDWRVFAVSAFGVGYVGIGLMLAYRPVEVILSRYDAFLLTALAWVAIGAFAALPFVFASNRLSYTDAFFESISGLTTTGSTVLVGLETMPPGILLWRGLLQWLGGIGIIAMAIAVLPYLRIGGMGLFRMESSDRSEKIVPRPMQLARNIVLVYAFLTLGCAILYGAAGMSAFDAAVHAMSTLSTGGFANSDASIGHFRSPEIEWIAVVFMILGSLPFVLYVRFLRGDRAVLWRDRQVRGFLVLLFWVVALFTLWLWSKGEFGLSTAFRLVAFNVVSIVTTTGYASTDYEQWAQGTEMLFLLLTIVGGCTGSTAGAVKVFRFQLMRIAVARRLKSLRFPNSVIPIVYNGRAADDEIVASVASFFFVFMAILALLTLALAALGLDFLTSLSGAATALCNVGPGLGIIIGPSGNFANLPAGAKWLLSAGMLLGRLELFTVLVLFLPMFWRR